MEEHPVPTLREAFTSTFHNKFSFEEFLNLDTNSEVTLRKLHDRVIYAPSRKLASFQRFIVGTILEYAEINTRVAFSYRKGTKASDALSKHRHNKYFYKTDITNFFHGFTKKDIADSLLKNLSKIPISDIHNHFTEIVSLCSHDDRLPIGFVTSPSLSNIILFDFDTIMESYCDSLEVEYSRYSDDIIFSSNERISTIQASKYLTKVLNDQFNGQLSTNLKKTKLLHKGQRIKLLGAVILPNGLITIDKTIKKEIEVFLFLYLNNRSAISDYFKKSLDEAVSEIEGKINYANNIDESYVEKLRSKYGNAIVDMLIHRSV